MYRKLLSLSNFSSTKLRSQSKDIIRHPLRCWSDKLSNPCGEKKISQQWYVWENGSKYNSPRFPPQAIVLIALIDFFRLFLSDVRLPSWWRNVPSVADSFPTRHNPSRVKWNNANWRHLNNNRISRVKVQLSSLYTSKTLDKSRTHKEPNRFPVPSADPKPINFVYFLLSQHQTMLVPASNFDNCAKSTPVH